MFSYLLKDEETIFLAKLRKANCLQEFFWAREAWKDILIQFEALILKLKLGKVWRLAHGDTTS